MTEIGIFIPAVYVARVSVSVSVSAMQDKGIKCLERRKILTTCTGVFVKSKAPINLQFVHINAYIYIIQFAKGSYTEQLVMKIDSYFSIYNYRAL